MASHSKVKVGSRGEWVVRKGGTDVLVVVLDKVPKASGRGFDFKLKALDASGQETGRVFTRGAGALRAPGTAARSAPPSALKRKAPSPAKKKAPPKPRKKASPRPTPSYSTPSYSTPSYSALPELPSLRGTQSSAAFRARKAAKKRPAKEKVAKPAGEVTLKVPSQLARKVMRAISRTDGSEYWIRKIVADTLSDESFRASYGHYPR